MLQERFKPDGPNPGWVAGIAFERPFSDNEFVAYFLPTIIAQLGDRFHAVQVWLYENCKDWDSGKHLADTPFNKAVEALFIKLATVIPQHGKAPFIIALDGLDYCDDDALEKAFQFIKMTLDAIPSLRFVIATSTLEKAEEGRIEDRIRGYLAKPTFADLVYINEVPAYEPQCIQQSLWI